MLQPVFFPSAVVTSSSFPNKNTHPFLNGTPPGRWLGASAKSTDGTWGVGQVQSRLVVAGHFFVVDTIAPEKNYGHGHKTGNESKPSKHALRIQIQLLAEKESEERERVLCLPWPMLFVTSQFATNELPFRLLMHVKFAYTQSIAVLFIYLMKGVSFTRWKKRAVHRDEAKRSVIDRFLRKETWTIVRCRGSSIYRLCWIISEQYYTICENVYRKPHFIINDIIINSV